MSSTGNRSNPNETRLSGRQEPQHRESHGGASGSDTHQESRDHNKHNHPGQAGHKPQKHNPAEEKH